MEVRFHLGENRENLIVFGLLEGLIGVRKKRAAVQMT